MKAIGSLGLVIASSLAVSACTAAQTGKTEGKRISASQPILAGSRPADGATVRGPLNSLELTFTRPAALAEVTVTGSDGTIMPTMVSPVGEVTRYLIPLPDLEAGRYRIVWKANARGVAYRGEIGFTIR